MRELKVKRPRKNAQGQFWSFRLGFEGRAFKPIFFIALAARALEKSQGEEEREVDLS